MEREEGLERDDYDAHAMSFGVFDKEERLAAYLRLIMPWKPFMLEREFRSLLSPGREIRRDRLRAEISRLCVAPEARKARLFSEAGSCDISTLLFKGVYQWCRREGIRYLYAVTEKKVYRLFRAKGFPYRPIGEPKVMADGVVAVAVMMDWREFETLNAARRPALLRWFTRYRSTPAQRRWRQPVSS